MTETITANIINEYTIANDEEGIKLYHVVDNIRNMPEGELKSIHFMSLNDKMRKVLNSSKMLLTMPIDGEVIILEFNIESDNTSWTVEPKWDEDDSLYFELSNPIKVHEQVNV